MGAVVANYNSVDLERIRWSKTKTAVMAGDNTVEAYIVTYTIHGVKVNASASAMASAITTVDTAFTKSGEDFKIWDGTSTIASLLASSCKGWGPHVEYDIPRDNFKKGFNFPVQLRVWGRVDPVKPDGSSTNTLSDEYTISYEHDAKDRIIRRKTGKVKASSGVSVLTLKDNVDPGSSADTYLTTESSFAGYTRTRESWRADQDNETADYEFVDEAYYVTPETTLKDVDLKVSVKDAGEGQQITIFGRASGDSTTDISTVESEVRSLIESKLPEGAKRLDQSLETDEQNNTVTFRASALSGNDDDIYAKEETYSKRTHYRKVILPYTGGGGEVAEVGSASIYVVIGGSIESLTEEQTPPDPGEQSGLVLMSKDISDVKPKTHFDGTLVYRRTYRFEYEGLEGGLSGGEGSGGTVDRITDGVTLTYGGGSGSVTLGL